jgi:hypothetical protein
VWGRDVLTLSFEVDEHDEETRRIVASGAIDERRALALSKWSDQ